MFSATLRKGIAGSVSAVLLPVPSQSVSPGVQDLSTSSGGSGSAVFLPVPSQSVSPGVQDLNTNSGGLVPALLLPIPSRSVSSGVKNFNTSSVGSGPGLLLPVPNQSVSPGVPDLNTSSGGSPLVIPSPQPQVLDPADDIFREALEGHKLGLSPRQQGVFLGASAVGLMDIVKELDQQHTVGSRTRRSIVKAQGFLEVANGYLNVLGIFIQHSPHYSALVVGGLQLFVNVSRNAVWWWANY